jgi:AcrR family transcriptional regulator
MATHRTKPLKKKVPVQKFKVTKAPRRAKGQSSGSLPRANHDAEQTRSRILAAAIEEFALRGYSGARIDRIWAAARSNPRMLYYYFGDKAALYVAVLEDTLGKLRAEEFKLGVDDVEPMAGIMTLFEFINGHFATHPELLQLLSGENLLGGQFLRGSRQVRVQSSPLIAIIAQLLGRGERDGSFRPGIDPLHLYVLMVALCYYHRSNAHTLSVLFETDLTAQNWQQEHAAYARHMLRSFLVSA